MEISSRPKTDEAAAIYRHEQDELRQVFCEAYRAWAEVNTNAVWWFQAREEAWNRYLRARLAWTGY